MRRFMEWVGLWLARAGRLLLRLSAPRPDKITNRAQLLIDPSEGEECDAFVPGTPGRGDCESDGHYLCTECDELSAASVERRSEPCL